MSVVNTNVNAQAAQNSLQVNSRSLATAMQQLSTGKRINAARDDAAGLAITTRMTADLRGMSMAIKNSNDGISMMQTAEGALGEITNMLQRMRELAVQSSTGSMSAANRKQLQAEFDQLVAEIDNVSKTTNFNGIKLLDGTAKGVRIQTGVNEGEQVNVDIQAASSKALGIQGYAIQGQLQSGRVGDLADVEFDDVLINGKEWALDGFTAITADNASGLASAINENTGQTGVRATAYNVVRGFLPTASSFSEGDLQVNGTSVKAAGSVEELVANINRDVGGITAVLERDGTITLSNNTGEDIEITSTTAGNALLAGFDEEGGLDGGGTYTGYVALESVDGSAIRLQARNPENGYSAGEGSLDDISRMGFNETTADGAVVGQQVMWFNVSDTDNRFGRLTLDDDVKINGVSVGVSSDGSAAAKAAAINAISGQTGVQASAFTEVLVSLDFDAADPLSDFDGTTTAKTFSINGTIINLNAIDGTTGNSASNLNDVVKAIEYYGPQGVKATATADGELLLTSDSGQNITIFDGDGDLVVSYTDTASDDTAPVGTRTRAGETGFTNAWQADDGNGGGDTDFTDGLADLSAAGAAEDTVYDDSADPDGVTFGGRLRLSSSIGAEIRLEGDYLSLRKLGLNEMGGSSGNVGGALNILTQDSAGGAITKIDSAINGVAMERATLGAFQNRLTAAVDNLSSTYTNLSDARSRILDTDYAKVTTELARAQIIQQAGTAMLAQANQMPQMVLGLLK